MRFSTNARPQLVHLIYNKYEFPPVNIFATFTLLVAIPFAPAYLIYLSRLIQPTWLSILISYFSFYTLLTTSIVIYRLSPIHPLDKYPGPKLARVSQLWAAFLAAGGKRHQYYKKLHDQYGPYVRVGKWPSTLCRNNTNSLTRLFSRAE